MELLPKEDSRKGMLKRVAEFMVRQNQPEQINSNIEYPDSQLLDTFYITSETNPKTPINVYKIYNFPEINDLWRDKIEDFYSNLSIDSKIARFNTAFYSVDDLSNAHQKSIFGTDGKTVSLVALDPHTGKIVSHAQRYIVKKSETRLQEVAIATVSEEKYLHRGIAFNLLNSLIDDASKYGVEYLEFYTSSKNKPVGNLNKKLIQSRNLNEKNIEIEDRDNPGWSYLYMYIGDDFSKEQIEAKVDLQKLKSVLVGDYLLTEEAANIRKNSALSPLMVNNIDELVLKRAQGVCLLARFEELYNAVHPKKSKNKNPEETKKRSKRSFWIFSKNTA